MGNCGCTDGQNDQIATYAGDNRTPEEMAAAGWPGRQVKQMGRYGGFMADLPFCLVFLLFWIGFIVVAAVGFENGDPWRLLYGRDYRGRLCGTGDPPAEWASKISACKAAGLCDYQSTTWSDNTKLWLPLPFNGDLENAYPNINLPDTQSYYTNTFLSTSNLDPSTALASGLCVSSCPQYSVGGSTPDVSDAFQSNALIVSTVGSMKRVYAYGVGENGENLAAPFYFVWYSSKEQYRRCINEDGAAYLNATMRNAVGDLPDKLGLEDFWQDALADLENSWRVLALCGATGLLLPFIYTMLLRVCMKPMIYLCMALAGLTMIGGGVMCYAKYQDLRDDDFPQNDDESKAWLAGACILWVLTAVYLLVICCVCKQIRIAIAIIQEATRVLSADPTLLLVAVFTGLTVLVLLAWCLLVGVYVYTSEESDSMQTLTSATSGTVGGVTYNVTGVSEIGTQQNLLYYTIFAWLWNMGLLNAIGFFVVSGATVKWYYSAKLTDDKGLTCFVDWFRCYCWAFMHIGGLATGTFIIAVIQFIRFLVKQFTDQAGKRCTWLDCIIQCCLACLERYLEWVTKNAYVIMAIEGCGFFCGVCKLMPILIDNIALMAIASCMGEVVFFIGKLFVVGANVCICWAMLDDGYLAPDVDNGILVCVVVGLFSLVLASLFMQVFSTAVDSMIVLVAREMTMIVDSKLTYQDAAMGDDIFAAVTGKDKEDVQAAKEEHVNDIRRLRQERAQGKTGRNEPVLE
eukprot:TRINITY_DN6751_c0_g2_i2.p1 TRINITY_DN6751_c0_g2~~TRINITY_DN6751_c0_g2_i2.p1  ORF type:complete len:743 (+),score=251.15 TRINITY_DN6751_c0_g2_i2:101-2329(+)